MEFSVVREVLASLFHETPVPTLLCDREGRILAANPPARRLAGNERIVGLPCREFCGSGVRLEHAVRDAFDGKDRTLDLDVTLAAGGQISALCDVFPARLECDVFGVFVHVRVHSSLLDDRIEQSLVTARRYRHGVALLYVGVESDEEDALASAMGRMRALVRESDTIAQAGAGAFAVLQPVIEDVEDALDLARKLQLVDAGASVGIAIFPEDGETPVELVNAAARALECAKAENGGIWYRATTRAREQAT